MLKDEMAVVSSHRSLTVLPVGVQTNDLSRTPAIPVIQKNDVSSISVTGKPQMSWAEIASKWMR